MFLLSVAFLPHAILIPRIYSLMYCGPWRAIDHCDTQDFHSSRTIVFTPPPAREHTTPLGRCGLNQSFSTKGWLCSLPLPPQGHLVILDGFGHQNLVVLAGTTGICGQRPGMLLHILQHKASPSPHGKEWPSPKYH